MPVKERKRMFQVPLDQDGNLVRVATKDQDGLRWEAQKKFKATLGVVGWRKSTTSRGGVGCYHLVDRENGHLYWMNPGDLAEVLAAGRAGEGGVMRGEWTFVRSGNTYSVRMVGV